ncbi:phosphatase PAP2 family protein [Cellulomonas sp. DKR-3]|uniref:Phosphatase PAP2 family protein n=1 Tax=Cellulomonas fulva TaxID=2835530 RepID=A0ABS5TVV7_9CELL|nr:phosphatase PAP2 family protein [Cellulomonas fulva]MBT0993249.1 phosphatase PAP2 family protein [Cellulomonas fulva]
MRPHLTRRRALLRAAAFGVGAAVPVLVLAYLVRSQASGLQSFDEQVVASATSFTREHPAVRDALLTWQSVFEPMWVNLAGTVVCVWVARRMPSRALWAFGTLMVTWGLTNLAKLAVGRARPVVEDALVDPPGASFPSGHATASAVAAVTLTVLLWPLLGRTGRVVVPVTGGLVVLVTCADRVMLGAHYPSDVLAGVLLGTAMAGASAIGYLGWSPRTDAASRADHVDAALTDPHPQEETA